MSFLINENVLVGKLLWRKRKIINIGVLTVTPPHHPTLMLILFL